MRSDRGVRMHTTPSSLSFGLRRFHILCLSLEFQIGILTTGVLTLRRRRTCSLDGDARATDPMVGGDRNTISHRLVALSECALDGDGIDVRRSGDEEDLIAPNVVVRRIGVIE